ncbi:MAG: hypothetical protein U0996_07860 [Planctomycetaceae bacterium]
MFDWKQLEEVLTTEATLGMNRWIKRNASRHAYAMAFHECYSELDGVITIPQLAVNAIKAKRKGAQENDDEGGGKWNSADWDWLEIFPSRSRLAKWEKLVRVAKSLYRAFAKSPQVTPDFVVYIDHEADDLDLVRRCVPAKLFKKHFSEFEQKQAPKGASKNSKLEFYMADMYSYEKQILALGKDAIPALIRKMNDPEDGWCAASLLGDLGIADASVIKALRNSVLAGEQGNAEHSARSLGLLGDLAFLLKAAKTKSSQEAAVYGLMVRLKDRASGRGIRLDYRPAEQLLAMNSSEVRQLVESEIAPGATHIEIESADIDEALRGLMLEEPRLRQHAILVLGRRKLGKSNARRILPAIAEHLTDSNATTRRLALLSLSYWKLTAEPWFTAMRALKNDKDSLVRQYAYNIMEEFKGHG